MANNNDTINPLLRTPPPAKSKKKSQLPLSPDIEIIGNKIDPDALINKYQQGVDDEGKIFFANLLTGEREYDSSKIRKNKNAKIINTEEDIIGILSESAIKKKKSDEKKREDTEKMNREIEKKNASDIAAGLLASKKQQTKEQEEQSKKLRNIIIGISAFVTIIIILVIVKYYVYDNTGCENLKLIDQSNIDSLKNKILTNTNNDKTDILNSFKDIRKSEEKIKNDRELQDEDKTFLINDLTNILKDNAFDPTQSEYNLLLKEIENTQKLLTNLDNANNEKNNNIKAYSQLQDKVKYYGITCE